MQREIKTLDGFMNLDDSNDVMPSVHHKEARNGVFKGNAPEMHFQAIRGNQKVTNASMIVNDCKLEGSVLFTPNCTIEGTAVYIPKCDFAATATWIPAPITMTTTVSCTAWIGSGKIVVSDFAGGWGSFSYISISTVSAADALSKLDSAGTRNALTGASYTYSNLGNNTYYIAIMDTGGLKGSKSVSVVCEEEPLNFVLNHTCNEGLGNSTVEAKTFTGGGGQYQISNVLHTSAANALAGTFIDVASATVSYYSVPDGTWYVALRDKNNTGNKITRSVVSDCVLAGECSCYTIVNTTAETKSIEFYNCDGNATSIGMPGGSTDWICVANGTVPAPVTGLTITKCSPTVPCTTSVGCFQCGSTDPLWVDQNYNTCVSCVTYDVYKDVNPNSASAGKYKVNGVIGTTTAPTSGDCNTDANYSENVGTYYSCSAGTVNSNTVYKNTNACFTGNQYKAGTVTYTTDPSNTSPSTDPILTDQGYYTCYNCVNRLVYKNTNECSPFYGYYYVNNDRLTTTAPPAGNCPTVANWVDLNFQTCYGCQNLWVYQDQSNCTSTSYKYRIGGEGGLVVDERPSNVLCDDVPNWVLTGYNTCVDCVNYAVYKDTKGCSPSYNKYRVNNVIVGYDEPSRGNCNTAADWQNEGPRVCIDCYSKQKQRDMNPCSPTSNTTRYVDPVYGIDPCYYGADYTVYEGIYHYCSGGTVYQVPVYSNSNVCFTGMATAQYRADFGGGNYVYYGTGSNPVNAYPDTTAIWYTLPIETDYYCDGVVMYYKEQDINQCSPTVGSYRMGGQYGVVAGYCGYNPTTCTSYEVTNFDANNDLYVNYTLCGGGAVSDTVGGGMTMTICAEEGSVSIGGFGSFSNIGSCSV